MSRKTVYETATNVYTQVKVLGEGGAGAVYEVSDVDNDRFALKVLRESSSAKRKRFKNELTFCRANRHPRIVTVLDDGVAIKGDQRLPFYVMRLYSSSLRHLMRQGIGHNEVLTLFNDILDGVEAAHLKGVVHRDLKPENVLVELENRRLVVADFGIAHFEEENLATAVLTKDQERLGNFRYAAPEQRTSARPSDQRTDIFALGLILNEMFTGEVPQGTGHKVIAKVAPQYEYLDEIVEQMIRQDPSDRPSSVQQIKEMLFVAGEHATTFQKLDVLHRTVVPVSTPDDPLGGVEVRAIEFSYEPGWLHFKLEPAPPPEWMSALHELGSYGSFPGLAEPSLVESTDRGAQVPAKESVVTEVAKYVKEWVNSANVEYRQRLAQKAKAQERLRGEALEQKRRWHEEKVRAMERLKAADLG